MEAQKVRFKAKSYFKDAWWEGYYVYSSINDKHYIVQDAQENGNLKQFVNFCHYAEVDPNTLVLIKVNNFEPKGKYEYDVFYTIDGEMATGHTKGDNKAHATSNFYRQYESKAIINHFQKRNTIKVIWNTQ